MGQPPTGSTSRFAPAGIGLKSQHVGELLERRPALPFVEIHAENYMGAGGPPHRRLSAVRRDYALSLHGVGLSLGGDEPLSLDHLDALAGLVARYEPVLVSEHLAWCRLDGQFLNDLLPIPYTAQSLSLFCDHVDQLQARLKRRILVENPAACIEFTASDRSEAEFLAETVQRTGCGILLDVNNLFVSARNLGWDEHAYLASVPAAAVEEIHLAGHHVRRHGSAEIRIDDHGSAVCSEVWALYGEALRRLATVPTLIEWDSDIPPLAVLLGQAERAGAEAARQCETPHAVAE
jgi:uncharacterized protein (UPF0276 family)